MTNSVAELEDFLQKSGRAWDPTTCENCGAPMTTPTRVGYRWMNHCTRCGLTRDVPSNYPLLQQQEQDKELANQLGSPWPFEDIGNQERPWITASERTADNYTLDSRDWPDPYEPRPSKAPAPHGCTCHVGDKLDCPVHGMHATQSDAEHDLTWAQPQGHPVGYPQDQPRNWTQALSRYGWTLPEWRLKALHESMPYSMDPDKAQEALQWGLREQRELDERDGLDGEPEIHSSGGRMAMAERASNVAQDPFMVSNGGSQGVVPRGDLRNVESSFSILTPLKQVSPIHETAQNDLHGLGDSLVNIASNIVHSNSPVVSKVTPHDNHETNHQANKVDWTPYVSSKVGTQMQSKANPGYEIENPPNRLLTKAHTQTVAADQYLYHNAPVWERERIKQHGLYPSNPLDSDEGNLEAFINHEPQYANPENQLPTGVYGYPTLEGARGWRDLEHDPAGEFYDTWRFPSANANEDPDIPGAQYVPHHVPNPELYETPEQRWQLAPDPERYGSEYKQAESNASRILHAVRKAATLSIWEPTWPIPTTRITSHHDSKHSDEPLPAIVRVIQATRSIFSR